MSLEETIARVLDRLQRIDHVRAPTSYSSFVVSFSKEHPTGEVFADVCWQREDGPCQMKLPIEKLEEFLREEVDFRTPTPG